MSRMLFNRIKKYSELYYHFKKSVIISWNASPCIFIFRIIIEIVNVLIPIISLYLGKVVINILSNDGYLSQQNDFYIAITAITTINIIGALIGKLNIYISGIHSDRVTNIIDMEIVDQINKLDISFFDNPIFYDQIQNSLRDSRSLQSLTWISVSIIKSIVQIVANTIILMGLNIYMPFIIFLLCIPGIIVDKYIAKRKYEWQLNRARNDRKLAYIKTLITSRIYAKDIRLFDVGSYFKHKYQNMWNIWFNEKQAIDKQRLELSFAASILPYLATTAVLIIVGNGVFAHQYSLGDYSLYGGIVTQIIASVIVLAGVINQSYESTIRLNNYNDFLNIRSRIKNDGTHLLDEIQNIEFKNVSFSYPGTSAQVIENISFSIHKNQSVAIVGLNGAGKSTIIKLLLRLYDPDSGVITVNGIDIKQYDIKSYYKCIGVIFQDFCRYNLKLRDVVAISDLQNVNDDEKILDACKQAGFDVSIMGTKGIDAYLGKIFDKDGVELSGGNWQKIAIAQAYFKKSSLMVFDEPNSALDPLSERNLFDKMSDLSREKCVVFVTHRLSSTTSADKIIVIDKGKCIEEGNHQELLSNNGVYHDLFVKQAENYMPNI